MSDKYERPEGEIKQIVALREAVGDDVSALMSDSDCMRFVRARKNDITKAAAMATDWATWWQTPFEEESLNGLKPCNLILDRLVDPEEHIYSELCPHTLYGFTKEGHPIYWERTGIISNALKELKTRVSLNTLIARHVRLQEFFIARLHYINHKTGKANTADELEKAVIVFDMAELGMSPDLFGINYVKQMFGVDGNYYPERLHKMIMINAPWYFSAIWALVSFCVDPVTAQKITIVGSDYQSVLQDLIDDDNIPKEMGGTAEVQWHHPYAEGTGCSEKELEEYVAFKRGVSTTTNGENSMESA